MMQSQRKMIITRRPDFGVWLATRIVLTLSPILILRESSRDNHHFRCIVCGTEESSYSKLSRHAGMTNHKTLRCRAQPCDYLYSSTGGAYRNHFANSHPELLKCSECNESFLNQWRFEVHAYQTGHRAITCTHAECGKAFARIDIFQRHQKTHEDVVKRHPCKHCRKYRGENGFKRKDHLTQHLRNYHHIGEDDARNGTRILSFANMSCPVEDCVDYRGPGTAWKDLPFQKSSDRAQHMRKVHNESIYPCPEPGCDRVGGKGYIRRADLRAHLRKVHGTNGALEGDKK
ncbi:hypothetical protein BCR34DRAFT_90324 [Clohesyomyces aquaticus]|uniref:C2H2-type domain-containing protein n=1 Tax=Clohesyomyces aquaticus TaxID=1231657 RepID=A0A1Y1YW64_9PLEO|nr:hypothetical protein BCR34DRAFT_90324 [Clohesyomyces aquaticus]